MAHINQIIFCLVTYIHLPVGHSATIPENKGIHIQTYFHHSTVLRDFVYIYIKNLKICNDCFVMCQTPVLSNSQNYLQTPIIQKEKMIIQ